MSNSQDASTQLTSLLQTDDQFDLDHLSHELGQILSSIQDKEEQSRVLSLLTKRFYRFESIVHAIAWKNAQKYSNVLQQCLDHGVELDKQLIHILSYQNPYGMNQVINGLMKRKSQHRTLEFYPRITLSVKFLTEEEQLFPLLESVQDPGITLPNGKFLQVKLETDTIADYTRDLTSKHMMKWVSQVSMFDLLVIAYSIDNAGLVNLMLNNLTPQLSQIRDNGTELVLLLFKNCADDDWKRMNNQYHDLSKVFRGAASLNMKIWIIESDADTKVNLQSYITTAVSHLSTLHRRAKRSDSGGKSKQKAPKKIIPHKHGVHNKSRI